MKNEIPQTNETEYVRIPDRILSIVDILAVRDKASKLITQIRFTMLNENVFTYKPFLRREVFVTGELLPTKEKEKISPTLQDVNQKVHTIYEIIKTKEVCEVETGYTQMNTIDKTGVSRVYCFFTEDDINRMEILTKI